MMPLLGFLSQFPPFSKGAESVSHTLYLLCVLGTEGRPRGRNRSPVLLELLTAGKMGLRTKTERHSVLGTSSANICELSCSRATEPGTMTQMMRDWQWPKRKDEGRPKISKLSEENYFLLSSTYSFFSSTRVSCLVCLSSHIPENRALCSPPL